MNAVINVALPVFAIIAAGYLSGKANILTAPDAGALNKFVFRIAMPAALFGLAARAAPPGGLDFKMAGAYAIAAISLIFAASAAGQFIFRLTKQEAGAHGFASTLGNAVFLGLPVALNVEGWDRPFIMLMAVEGTVLIVIGAALMARREEGKGPLSYLKGPLANPLVIALAAGFAYSWLGFSLSGPFETFFGFLGRAAGATALVSLGLFLATHDFPPVKQVAGRVAFITAIKMAALPAAALGLAHLFGVTDPDYVGALALFTVTPSAVAVYIMASQYETYVTESAAAVFVTTLLSVLTISSVLGVFA